DGVAGRNLRSLGPEESSSPSSVLAGELGGQEHREDGAALSRARATADADQALMLAHDSFGKPKSQARPAFPFRRVEGLEDAGQIPTRDSAAVVGYYDADALALIRRPFARAAYAQA